MSECGRSYMQCKKKVLNFSHLIKILWIEITIDSPNYSDLYLWYSKIIVDVNYCTKTFFKTGHFKRCSLSWISKSSSLANAMPERGRGCTTTAACSILHLSQIRVKADINWCNIVLHAPGPGWSSAFFLYFPSGRRFPNCPLAKLSDDHPLGKLWQRDPIHVGLSCLNEWCRQKKISLESPLLVQIAVPF